MLLPSCATEIPTIWWTYSHLEVTFSILFLLHLLLKEKRELKAEPSLTSFDWPEGGARCKNISPTPTQHLSYKHKSQNRMKICIFTISTRLRGRVASTLCCSSQCILGSVDSNSVEKCCSAPMWLQSGQWNGEGGHCGWQEAHCHT